MNPLHWICAFLAHVLHPTDCCMIAHDDDNDDAFLLDAQATDLRARADFGSWELELLEGEQ